jgi:hypothetical protein
MRILVLGCSLLLIAGTGCIHRKPKGPPGQYSAVPGLTDVAPAQPQAAVTSNPKANTQPTITPENVMVGKIKSVNTSGRFVILSFPPGQLPSPDQVFGVYRRGQKVGEIKTTSERLNDLVVADIADGDAAEGDDVRNR